MKYLLFGYFSLNTKYLTFIDLKNIYVFRPNENFRNKIITFILTMIKTFSHHHFESYEYLVKIYEDLLSTHNQIKF